MHSKASPSLTLTLSQGERGQTSGAFSPSLNRVSLWGSPVLPLSLWERAGVRDLVEANCIETAKSLQHDAVPSSRARSMRKNPTWAERLMWRWLKDRRFTRYKFRRQHPMGAYTLDFYCSEARISIELDGTQHG